MRISVLSATLVASLFVLGLTATTVYAQGGARPASTSIAVIDITKVFKEHVRFKGWLENMKTDAKATDEMLKAENKRINELIEQLNGFQPGTPNYKGLEAKIVEERSKLEGRVKLQKKEFMDREAMYYNTVYKEITTVVNSIAAQNSLSLVLSYNSEPIDPNDRRSIQMGLSKQIVYSAPQMDITAMVIGELNRGATPQTPSHSATRQGVAPR